MRGEFNDGCALVGRHGRAHRHRPYHFSYGPCPKVGGRGSADGQKQEMIAGRGSADGLKQEKVAGRGSADGLKRKRSPEEALPMDKHEK